MWQTKYRVHSCNAYTPLVLGILGNQHYIFTIIYFGCNHRYTNIYELSGFVQIYVSIAAESLSNGQISNQVKLQLSLVKNLTRRNSRSRNFHDSPISWWLSIVAVVWHHKRRQWDWFCSSFSDQETIYVKIYLYFTINTKFCVSLCDFHQKMIKLTTRCAYVCIAWPHEHRKSLYTNTKHNGKIQHTKYLEVRQDDNFIKCTFHSHTLRSHTARIQSNRDWTYTNTRLIHFHAIFQLRRYGCIQVDVHSMFRYSLLNTIFIVDTNFNFEDFFPHDSKENKSETEGLAEDRRRRNLCLWMIRMI